MKQILRIALLVVLAASAAGWPSSCTDDDLKAIDSIFDFMLGAPIKEPLTGQNAYLYLQQDKSRTPQQSRTALLGALSTADASDKEFDDPGYEAVDLLQKNIRAKQNIRVEKYPLIGAKPEVPEGESLDDRLSIDLGSLDDEYLIPHMEAVPVRNQLYRGTCAAFAGIGHLEFAVLQKMPELGTVDLSEQRFYYNSKPECHSSGCTLNDEGSWYGVGMEESVAASDYDIPREQDCVYNGDLGNTDVQIPLDDSCWTGAVKVVQLKFIQDPAEMVAVLENDGLPIPYASTLSDNWRYNDGLITKNGSDYDNTDKHSGGHAYLIVGYRKLPDMPEEGGMCFIIKNSWGDGWGVNGYSCMTLEWMESWGWNYLDQPIAMDVMINEDILTPSREDEEDEEDIPDYFVPDIYDDDTVDWDDYEKGDEEDIPDPEPPPPEIEWEPFLLKGPDDFFYQVEIYEIPDAGIISFRGTIRNTDKPTGIMDVEVDGDGLYYDGDRVGDLKDDHAVLCTGPYDVLCSLRIDKSENLLYIEFVNPEFRRVKAEDLDEGEWTPLFDPGDGFNIEFFDSDNLGERLAQRFILVRLEDDGGEKTEAMRLSLDGLKIKLMGEPIGSINPTELGLCTGSYRDNCKLYRARHGLTIVPKARPKQ